MHDRFVLLKRKRDLNDKEALLLDGWTKNYPELGAAYTLKEGFSFIVVFGWVAPRRDSGLHKKPLPLIS